MSWLLELRKQKDNATAFYEILCEHAAHFSAINRLWQHEGVLAKPDVMMFDMWSSQKPILTTYIQNAFPHVWWLRENLSSDKVALIYTTTEDRVIGKLVTPSKASSAQGFYLQGFMFTDPADAVMFKLMWSEHLA